EMDIAVVGCGVSLTVKNGICTAARIGLGAVAPTALLVEAAAKALIGSKLDDAALEAAAEACRAGRRPIDAKRGTIAYRTQMLAAEAKGREIGTIEGMSQGGRLNSLQQKFLELAALQCGICTSGMLIASEALLKKNPNPSEEEVRFWLAGNLCRCTGYDKIVRAVLETAQEMRAATN